MRTQVAIIGGGPAGILLSRLLTLKGIDTVVIESKCREDLFAGSGAAVLEQSFVDLLDAAGVSDRLHREGIHQEGIRIAARDRVTRIPLTDLTGRTATIYGKSRLIEDLYRAQDALGAAMVHDAGQIDLHDLASRRPYVTYVRDGDPHRLDCDFIAGCDGYDGICRAAIPASRRSEFQRIYPFNWLGVLCDGPPVRDEPIYAHHDRGFALCALNTAGSARYYIQCPAGDRIERWTDNAFWDELRRRLPAEIAETLETGPSLAKTVSPLQSFVCETMRWGQMFLCGGAAHVVPPMGSKALNLVASDAYYLSEALGAHYLERRSGPLGTYAERALDRIWRAERFAWWMTKLLHSFPDESGFDLRLQRVEQTDLATNEALQRLVAGSYVGRPY